MSKKRGGRRNQGFGPLLVGGVMSLIMIGIVLAALQLTGVSSVSDTVNFAKNKAAEYAECIPSGECGLVSIIEGINIGGEGGSFNLGGSNSGESGNSSTNHNGKNVVLPESPGFDFKFDDFSLGRETESYEGPAEGKPYVNDAGLVNKNAAQSMLETLNTVSDKEDKDKDVGYSRKEWKHWTGSEDRSCWNTREEVLYRDAVPGTVNLVDKQKNATDNYEEACAFGTPVEEDGRIRINTDESGVWIDPYSNDEITSSSEIDIDHVIPLSNAARNGGQDWTLEQKEMFANDPDNLLATSAKENRAKGDKGPAEYMPPNKSYHCSYAKTYTSIAYKYGLTITESDYEVLEKAIESCKH